MADVTVTTVIAAPPARVWAAVEDIATHVEWMQDAEAIRFTSEQRHGVGTTFDCDTRIGPLRLTDRMTVTEWDPARVMGVRHVGAVEGTGRFTLDPVGVGATRFTWKEDLRFPWWLAGPVGAAVARPVFGWIWRRNLSRLKAIVERAAD